MVASVGDVERFGFPCVLKTTRGGYDGKGVWFVRSTDDCGEAFASAEASGCGSSPRSSVEFRRELSALVARPERAGSGVPGRRVHPEGRHLSRGGRAGSRPVRGAGRGGAGDRAADRRRPGRDGVLAVEFFETHDGRVLVNELAMRPHNTGHWTQDGAVTSQFENHLRAVLDLPLGSPAPRARWTVMVNILGGPDETVGRLYDGYPTRWPVIRSCACTSTASSCGRAARSATSTRTATTSTTVSSARGTPPRGSVATWATRASRPVTMQTARVGIVMGSDSDWPVMRAAAEALAEFDVPHEADVVSAHRMPQEMLDYGRGGGARGLSVIIAGAGGAAHLPACSPRSPRYR